MKTVIYSKYSNERNPALAIRTDILEDEKGKRCVQKRWEFPEGQEHVEKLCKWYDVFSKMTQGTQLSYNRCEKVPGGVELEYVAGENLEEHLLTVMREQGLDACAQEFLDYLNLVKSLHSGEIFKMTEEFRAVFGEAGLLEGTPCAPCSNIDLVCGNILLDGEKRTVIDYEWSFDFPIPAKYLLFRIIFYFTDHADRGTEFKSYDFLGKMGITPEEVKVFECMETRFQQFVTRNHVPIRDLYQEVSDGVFWPEDVFAREVLQIYFDLGEGFCEENSISYQMLFDGHWHIRKEIPLPKGLKTLRVDPGNRGTLVKLKQFRFDCQENRAPFTMKEGAAVGDWLYMQGMDPNLFVTEIPEKAKNFLVELEVYPQEEKTAAELDHLAKEYVRQKRALRDAKEALREREQMMKEMENTKVWKMYRKYRDMKEK
jgi:hypothetical protein